MGEVLSFFLFIFAIFRLCVNIGADGHGRRMERKFGSGPEYEEKWCDPELEKDLRLKLQWEEYYEPFWEELEHAWETRRAEIDSGPERPKQIWHNLMKGGRKPFNMYSSEFLKKHGYNFWNLHFYDRAYADLKNHYCMTARVRALYCLMWIRGKRPEVDARIEYRLLYGMVQSYDVMIDPDAGTKDDRFLKNRDIPW